MIELKNMWFISFECSAPCGAWLPSPHRDESSAVATRSRLAKPLGSVGLDAQQTGSAGGLRHACPSRAPCLPRWLAFGPAETLLPAGLMGGDGAAPADPASHFPLLIVPSRRPHRRSQGHFCCWQIGRFGKCRSMALCTM